MVNELAVQRKVYKLVADEGMEVVRYTPAGSYETEDGDPVLSGYVKVTVKHPGTRMYGAVSLDNDIFRRCDEPAVDQLLYYEIRDLCRSIRAEVEYVAKKAANPDLVWLKLGRACPVHNPDGSGKGPWISVVDRGGRAYRCTEVSDHHPWPDDANLYRNPRGR